MFTTSWSDHCHFGTSVPEETHMSDDSADPGARPHAGCCLSSPWCDGRAFVRAIRNMDLDSDLHPGTPGGPEGP